MHVFGLLDITVFTQRSFLLRVLTRLYPFLGTVSLSFHHVHGVEFHSLWTAVCNSSLVLLCSLCELQSWFCLVYPCFPLSLQSRTRTTLTNFRPRWWSQTMGQDTPRSLWPHHIKVSYPCYSNAMCSPSLACTTTWQVLMRLTAKFARQLRITIWYLKSVLHRQPPTEHSIFAKYVRKLCFQI